MYILWTQVITNNNILWHLPRATRHTDPKGRN